MEVQTNLMPLMPSQMNSYFAQVERIRKKCRLIDYLPLPSDMTEVIKSFLFYDLDAFNRKKMKKKYCNTICYSLVKSGHIWRQQYEWYIYERNIWPDLVRIMLDINSTTCIHCGNYKDKDMEEIPVSSCIKCICQEEEETDEEVNEEE